MRLKELMRSNKGSGYILTVAVCLVLLLLFCVIAEYARVSIIVKGVRDAAQQAVIATANDNYDDLYHSAREGYAAGWTPTADDWEESLDFGSVYANFALTLGLTEENGHFVKYAGSTVEFTLLNLEIDVLNNALASGEREGFAADMKISISLPLHFAGSASPPLELDLRTQAKYVPLF